MKSNNSLEEISFFGCKRDIVHFMLGVLTGIAIVIFVSFDKILY